MQNKYFLVVLSILVFIVICFPIQLHAQNSGEEGVSDLENPYVDDVDFFDDKNDDLFDDFDRIIAEDLDVLFDKIVIEEDFEEQKMVPALIDEEIKEPTLTSFLDAEEGSLGSPVDDVK